MLRNTAAFRFSGLALIPLLGSLVAAVPRWTREHAPHAVAATMDVTLANDAGLSLGPVRSPVLQPMEMFPYRFEGTGDYEIRDVSRHDWTPWRG